MCGRRWNLSGILRMLSLRGPFIGSSTRGGRHMWWHLMWEQFLRIPSGKPPSTAFTTPPPQLIPLPTDCWMEFSKVLPSFEFSCPHMYPYSPLYLWWTNTDNNQFEPLFYFYYCLISRASSIPGFPLIVSFGMRLFQFIFACSFRYRFFLILMLPCYLSTVPKSCATLQIVPFHVFGIKNWGEKKMKTGLASYLQPCDDHELISIYSSFEFKAIYNSNNSNNSNEKLM